MSGNGPCPNNICPMVIHVQKKYVSKDGSCPNNLCPMVVHVQKMCVQGWFIDLLICMFINEVLVRSCSLNSEIILK